LSSKHDAFEASGILGNACQLYDKGSDTSQSVMNGQLHLNVGGIAVKRVLADHDDALYNSKFEQEGVVYEQLN